MATVSGTFTAVGQSATLDVPALGEDITISLTGGATATVLLQRERVPHADVWHTVRTYFGNVEASFRQERKNERYRFNCTSYTTGTVTYSVSDGDKVVGGTPFVDSVGNVQMTLTQAGVDIPGTLTVDGAVSYDGGINTGTLDLASGSITDSSGAIDFGNETLDTDGTITSGTLVIGGGTITDTSAAISFGDENLSTTGTAATGALTVTGAISDTAASSFTTAATIGNLTLGDGSIVDSSGAISFGDEALATTGTITQAGTITTLNVGTVPGTVTAVEYGDGYNHVTVLTVTAAVLVPDIPADDEEVGALIYTFPAGVHRVNMTHLEITAASVAADSANADLGCGSTLAAGDGATLQASTDEDFIDGLVVADMTSPSVNVTEAGDGTIFASGDSKAFHINVASGWSGTNADPSITGTVTIAWTFMGA